MAEGRGVMAEEQSNIVVQVRFAMPPTVKVNCGMYPPELSLAQLRALVDLLGRIHAAVTDWEERWQPARREGE